VKKGSSLKRGRDSLFSKKGDGFRRRDEGALKNGWKEGGKNWAGADVSSIVR